MSHARGFDLSDRVALVTGASRGLGAAIAVALAEAGASIIAWARHRPGLTRLERTLRAHGTPVLTQLVDVTKPRVIRHALIHARKQFPRLDVLVNNAAIWAGDPLITLTSKTWHAVLESDLTSVFLVSQAVAPTMIRQGYGKIITISSTSAFLAHLDGGPYCAAKAGVVHLTRVMAREWGPHGIRVNSIAPGLFRTDMTADVFEDHRWIARRQQQVPLRRFGEPQDLGGLAVFLASAASDYVTGQTIVIDGGALLATSS